MNCDKQKPVGGVIVPAATPLTPAGRVDEAALRQLIARCVSAGVSCIFIGGSAGMGPLLTDAQWEEALSVAVDETGTKARVLAGIIAPSTQRALLQIAASRRLGCSAIVVTPTFYITLRTSAEMLAHFRACREATDQDMVIYNIPSCTSSSIPPDVVRTAAQQKWTRAMKESSGNREYFLQVLEAVRGLDVAVLQGNEPDIAWGLTNGAAGIVPVCANCEPQTFVAAVRAAERGDKAELDRLQQRIDALRDTVLIGDHNWIAGLMGALAVQGIGNGKPLLPLQEIGPERRQRIADFFAGKTVA